MRETIFEQIPFTVEIPRLLKILKIKENTEEAWEIAELAKEAETVGKPKAAYLEAFIEKKGDNFVLIEGTVFKSKVLRINLEQAHRIFPYIATCGRELEDWSESFSDFIKRFWADAIKQMALKSAIDYLMNHITEYEKPGKVSTMNPGSLEDWPIQEQESLFSLLSDCSRKIGVELTDSFLMIPVKSVSGICFPTEVTFESCQLCPRLDCPGRRAPYNQELYNKKYKLG